MYQNITVHVTKICQIKKCFQAQRLVALLEYFNMNWLKYCHSYTKSTAFKRNCYKTKHA